MASFNLKSNLATILSLTTVSAYDTGGSKGRGTGSMVHARIQSKANEFFDLKIDTAFATAGRLSLLKNNTASLTPLLSSVNYTGGSNGRGAGGMTVARIADAGVKILTPSFLGIEASNSTAAGLILLARIKLDAGDRLVSLTGIATATKFYGPRLVSVDDISREISVQPGEFRAAEITLTLDNTDDFFSDIRTAEPLIGRTVEVLLFDAAIGESDATVIAAGEISSWSGTSKMFTINAQDLSLNRLDQVIDDRIDTTNFPDVPDETSRELVPLVIGLVSSEGTGQSNTGALPAYLVDPAIAQSKYQYVACQREVKDIPNVYVYGVVTVSGFTIQTRTLGGKTYTTIEFAADQRDSARSNELEITCDVDGITDDGTSSGNRISNPARIWEEVLLQNGFVAGDIDAAKFTTAAAAYAGRSVTGGFASIDTDETLRDIAEKMALSFNMTTIATRAGKLGISVPEPGAVTPSSPVSIDESEIVRDSFSMAGPDELASAIDYRFAKNWHLDEFDLSGAVEDAGLAANLNRDVRVTAELDYVRHVSAAAAIANDKLFFLSDQRVLVEARADVTLLRSVDVGDTVTFKHFSGIPFSPEHHRVLGAGLSFDGPAMLLALSLIDYSQTVLTGTKLFRDLVEPSQLRSDHFHNEIQGTGLGLGLR